MDDLLEGQIIDENEYKPPKFNPAYRIIVWTCLALNVFGLYLQVFWEGTILWLAVAGVGVSIFNIYMHYARGIDLWNGRK